jgi:hypothetical protein
MIDSRARTARAARRRGLALAGLLVLAATSGCTSSKGNPSRSGPPAPTGTDVASGVGAAAATEVTTAYLRFFDPSVAEAQKLQLIQDGAAFSQAISVQFRSEFARAVSVRVTKVNVNSANRATVIFTLLLDGKASRPNQTGYAVHEDGRWKVAGATFCDVLSTQGAPPPVCTSPSATTLPG